MNLDMEKYKKIRAAQTQGARTIEEIQQSTTLSIDNDEERKKIEEVLKSACSCEKVSIETVLNAIEQGASTVEEIGEATGAGTHCGRCKALLANIIETKR